MPISTDNIIAIFLDNLHTFEAYLKIDYAASFSGRIVTIVRQRLPLAIEDEPPLVPMMKLFAHLRQIATATRGVDRNIIDQGQLVSGGFYVMPQVQRLRLDRQISREWPL